MDSSPTNKDGEQGLNRYKAGYLYPTDKVLLRQ